VLKLWGYPWLTYPAIAGMVAVILAMALVHDVRAQLWWSLGSLALVLTAAWWRYRRAQAPAWSARGAGASPSA
jgi:GABA permease